MLHTHEATGSHFLCWAESYCSSAVHPVMFSTYCGWQLLRAAVYNYSAEQFLLVGHRQTVHLSVGEVRKSLVCFFFHRLYEWITLSQYALRFVKLCRTRTKNSLSQSKAVWEQIWKSTQVYKNAGRPDKGRLFASRGKTFLSRVWYHCRL